MSVKAVKVGNGELEVAQGAIFEGTSQVLAITSGAANSVSTAFGSATSLVRIATTVNCFVTFGAAPVATASTSIMLPANTVAFFGVTGGHKIGVLPDGVTGKLCVTEAL